MSRHMHPVSGVTSPRAVEHYDNAVTAYVSMAGDPAVELQRAIDMEPDFLMAHALLGMMGALSTGVLSSNPVRVAARRRDARTARGVAVLAPLSSARLRWRF